MNVKRTVTAAFLTATAVFSAGTIAATADSGSSSAGAEGATRHRPLRDAHVTRTTDAMAEKARSAGLGAFHALTARAPAFKGDVLAAQGVDLGRFASLVRDVTGEPVSDARVLRAFANGAVLVAYTPNLVCLRYRTPGQQPDGAGGGGGMGCAPSGSATDPATPLAVYGAAGDNRFFAAALLPDGTSGFTVQTDAATKVAGIVNNVGYVETAAVPRVLRWTSPDGRQRAHEVADVTKPH